MNEPLATSLHHPSTLRRLALEIRHGEEAAQRPLSSPPPSLTSNAVPYLREDDAEFLTADLPCTD